MVKLYSSFKEQGQKLLIGEELPLGVTASQIFQNHSPFYQQSHRMRRTAFTEILPTNDLKLS